MAKGVIRLSEDSSSGRSSGIIGGEDEEFYEEIEAPKFVDFTAPDHYCPDDRYWFCLRVGCDQKHEKEIDPEAISKNFILRVMAARSPNVRLQKALNRNVSSKNMKCPLSAPPKPAKSRLPRLAIVSMSQKMGVISKEKAKLIPKVGTPKAKGKQVAAKYLTTPRNKKIAQNSNSFRSVQNQKPASIAMPKSRLVAKALVFHSPKKAINLKSSVELRTPLTKLCQGMKKLEITSQRKRLLGYSSKPSKALGLDSQKSLPLNSSTRKKVFNKERNCMDIKSLRSGKCKSKGNLSKECRAETVMNLRDDGEEHLAASNISGHNTSTDSAKEAASQISDIDSTSTKISKGEFDSSEKSAETSMGGDDIPTLQALKNTKDGSENEKVLKDHVPTCQSEMIESDDKENASAFDENRRIDHSNIETGEEIIGIKNTDKKVAQAVEKNSKVPATISAPGMKLMKPKPTNPKPFRLRTDERGILREANLERKNHTTPQKEAAAVTKFHAGDAQGLRGDIQKGSNRSAAAKTPTGKERTKTPTTPKVSRPLTSILENNAYRDMENHSRQAKSPSSRVLQPQRMKQMASQTKREQTSLTGENPSEDSKHMETKSPGKNGAKSAVRSKTPSSSKSSCRGRRPVTIPKEPNFHTSHMPKSCVKKIA